MSSNTTGNLSGVSFRTTLLNSTVGGVGSTTTLSNTATPIDNGAGVGGAGLNTTLNNTANNGSVGGVGSTTTLNNTADRTNDLIQVHLEHLPSASSTSSPSNSTQPSPDPATNALRLDVQPQPLHTRKIYLYNDLGNAAGAHCEMSRTQEAAIQQAYGELRALVNHNATKMAFNLSKMTVTYTENNTVHIRDLQEIVDGNAQCMEKYRILADAVQPIWGGALRTEFIDAGRRTAANSPIPLNRYTEPLQQLPTSYTESAKLAMKLTPATQHEQALKRIAAAEKLLAPLSKKIAEKLNVLNTQFSSATQDQQRTLIAQLREWEQKKKQLEADRTALYLALASYPITANPTMEDVARAVRAMQKKLHEYIEQQRVALKNKDVRTSLPKWKILSLIRGKALPIPEDKVYPADAAALLFSAKPAAETRGEYYRFITEQPSLMAKREGLEDELIRFVLGGATTVPSLDHLINSIPDATIKAECETAFRNAKADRAGILTNALPVPAGSTIDQQIVHLNTQVYHFE